MINYYFRSIGIFEKINEWIELSWLSKLGKLEILSFLANSAIVAFRDGQNAAFSSLSCA
jgi:hypothetical protein